MSDNTKFGPPKGMRDWLPQETLLRQKLIRLIEHHYQLYGFQPIDTPVMENIEVLQGKGGGENEKLMFKVAKRGDELERALEEKRIANKAMEDGVTPVNAVKHAKIMIGNYEIADMGLRFDLTVPLARYYSNHANDIPKPFRCYHIGPVWRAENSQRGRYREFYQCDIDIIGGASDSYEVELLLATDRVLKELNVGKFKIRISDKRLLPALLSASGLKQQEIQKVSISIDKLDKQPLETIWEEIKSFGIDSLSLGYVETLIRVLSHKDLKELRSFLKDFNPAKNVLDVIDPFICSAEKIQKNVKEINPGANVIFDPLLVRGFDYYTGPVFEINVEDRDFTFSIGGGGRYDGLIEKLGGPKNTSAVGISLGFERILLILMEKAKSSDAKAHSPRIFVANNGQSEKDILTLAEELRSEGIQVEASLENKKIGQQLETAQKNGIEYAITKFTPGEKSYTVRKLSNRQDREMTLAELYDIMKRLSEEIED